MPFIHNMNCHKRISFELGIESIDSGDRFTVWVVRSEFNLKFTKQYYPTGESIDRIKSILDSNLFNVKVDIQPYLYKKSYGDYMTIEIV